MDYKEELRNKKLKLKSDYLRAELEETQFVFQESLMSFQKDFDNYLETYNWMHDIASAKGKEVEDLKEDATLLVFTSHNNVNKTIRFKDIFPTAIGALEFTSTAQEVNYLSTEINFSYTNFEFE